MRHTIIGLSALACLAMVSVANGAIEMSLPAVRAGTYYDSGVFATSLPFVSRDTTTSYPYVFRNWFTFDLSTLSKPVQSAVLWVDVQTFISEKGDRETLALHQIALDPDKLGNGDSADYYRDLGDDGPSGPYGSREFGPGDVGTLLPITLSAGAVADLNIRLGAGQDFEIGGTLASDDGTSTQYLIFGPVLPTLTVRPVPEPATIIIWSLLGALGIAVGVYRRRKAA